jgi:hypothetical protein
MVLVVGSMISRRAHVCVHLSTSMPVYICIYVFMQIYLSMCLSLYVCSDKVDAAPLRQVDQVVSEVELHDMAKLL